MVKSKKGFNWKARSQISGSVDLSQAKLLEDKLEKNEQQKSRTGGGFEGSNALVMPAKGNKFNVDKNVPVVGKILSRKQRKRLEQIVDKKKKKEGRAELLAALSSVQTDSLEGYESLSSVQTKGVKKQLVESKENISVTQIKENIETAVGVNSPDKLTRKRKKTVIDQRAKIAKRPDVVGFETDSSSENESLSDEDLDDLVDAPPPPVQEEPTTNSEPTGGHEDDSSGNVEEDHDNDDTKSSSKVCRDEDDHLERLAATSYKPSDIKVVSVARKPDVQEARSKLPILAQEQEIMETINSHGVVVLSGETGCGKTTQIPQFLYEAGYASHARIGITEPRRVAATSMARRVGDELNLTPDVVSYQIRYEGNVTDSTKIKFMTDGVLLREIEKDFLLTGYSVIIIDEAHERSVFTETAVLDILIDQFPRLKKTPKSPLKVIIMSATLRVEDFTTNTRLFKTPPPVVSVESRQFPVTVHFNKKTSDDYMSDAYKKVCKIHNTLPDGGILVFVTGQQEVNILVKKLRSKYPGKNYQKTEERDSDLESTLKQIKKRNKRDKDKTPSVLSLTPEIDLSNYKAQPLDTTETDVFVNDDEDADLDDADDEAEGHVSPLAQPLHVLPLYSMLSSDRQNLIWAGPPAGARLCVVATNIAETSLTIPGVKYVVDSGKVKVKHYDKVTGVSTFLVEWISQAQANQRAGRAGRQGPGHCYRLYSSSVYSDLPQFSKPEILSRPVEDLLLQMKTMNIDKVINFPFPTCPDTEQLQVAETRLQQLGCLETPARSLSLQQLQRLQYCSAVTPLGRAVTSFPLAPRFGKMLALAHQHSLLGLTLTLVSALTVQEVLVEAGLGQDQAAEDRKVPGAVRQLRRDWAGSGHCLQLGDPMVLIQAFLAAERASFDPQTCGQLGLRHKAVQEIRRLRRQLAGAVREVVPGPGPDTDTLAAPDQAQARLLQQLLLAGSPHLVARRIPEEEEREDKERRGGYRTGAMEQLVFLHSSSVLARERPEWVVAQELVEVRGRVLLRGVTAICPTWLPSFCPGQVVLGEPSQEPGPRYCDTQGTVMATYRGTFGQLGWQLPPTELEMEQSLDKYKWFGRFLLEGSVAPGLAQYASSLLSNPLVMVKSWSSLQKRTELLVRELAQEQCDTRARLALVWARRPQYLLSSYLAWLPEVIHSDVTKTWPPSLPS